MLKYSGPAELKKFVPRKHYSNEEWRKACTLQVCIKGMPIEIVEEGFVAQLSLIYADSEIVQLSGIGPLTVSREVNNVHVQIGKRVVLKGADLENVTLQPLAGRLVDVSFDIVARDIPAKDGIASDLWSAAGETIDLLLEERQAEIVERMIKSVAADKPKRRRRNGNDHAGVSAPP